MFTNNLLELTFLNFLSVDNLGIIFRVVCHAKAFSGRRSF